MFNQEKLVEMYSGVIHHVLYRHEIYSHHQNYDDYFNELYIKLLDLAVKFRGDVLNDAERGRFTAYAKAGLERQLWWLKKREQQFRHEVPIDMQIHHTGTDDGRESLEVIDFFADAECLLDRESYDFLRLSADTRWSVAEKAHMLGISRKTYYQKRRRIMTLLQELRQDSVQ